MQQFQAKKNPKDKDLNNQFVDFHSYSALLIKREREILPTSWSVVTRKKRPEMKSNKSGEDLVGWKF